MSANGLRLLMACASACSILACSPARDKPEGDAIDGAQRAQEAAFRVEKDPVLEEIQAFRHETRQWYNRSCFDELEQRAAELRANKPIFGNGRWKIQRFYDALECADDEREGMWQLHERIHKDWIAKKPESITARVAYADFLVSYAWHARGSGYADKVTPEGWRLLGERLASSQQVLDEAQRLPEKDPYIWYVALRVALGQGWKKADYDALLEKAHAAEPMFWICDTARAYSLLPRWYGKPGDWERFALKAAARADGVGGETYARIVIHLMSFYGNIFAETQASWEKTREGLEQMLKKYPDSREIIHFAALLASLAEDREFAKAMFDQLGDAYLPSAWGNAKRFAAARKWATSSPALSGY